MDVGMHLGQSQRLEQNISPQMLQSIAILQKNSLELETAIKAEVEANPMLEFDDEPLGESLDSPAETSRESEADFDTEDTSRNSDDSTVPSLDFERGTLEDSADVDHGLLDGSFGTELGPVSRRRHRPYGYALQGFRQPAEGPRRRLGPPAKRQGGKPPGPPADAA